MEPLASGQIIPIIKNTLRNQTPFTFTDASGFRTFSLGLEACADIVAVYEALSEHDRERLLTRYRHNTIGLAVFCSRLRHNRGLHLVEAQIPD